MMGGYFNVRAANTGMTVDPGPWRSTMGANTRELYGSPTPTSAMPNLGGGNGQPSFGAGRFMQGGLPSMPATHTTPGPESAMQAFQPNYSLFYNPREMLGAGQPSFQDPMWYQSTTAPPPPPEPTGPDMSDLYSPWWSGQMPSSPGVNVMSMGPRQRVAYLNSLVNPAQFQALGGNNQMGGRSMLDQRRSLSDIHD